MSQPSLGIALILSSMFGMFGADKFYAGAFGIGCIQLFLTLTIIGLLISIPWATLSTLFLTISILYGTSPMFYPSVDWAPLTQNDKLIAYIVIGLYVFSLVMAMIAKTEKKIHKNDNKNNKNS